MLDDEALCDTVMGELKSLLDIQAKPLGYAIQRWPASYPQADVGHLGRVDRMERGLPAGLAVTGSSYRGLGVPDCIEQGREHGCGCGAGFGGLIGFKKRRLYKSAGMAVLPPLRQQINVACQSDLGTATPNSIKKRE